MRRTPLSPCRCLLAVQIEHLPSEPAKLRLQRHDVCCRLPFGNSESAGLDNHSPFERKKLALHSQSLSSLLPASELESEGHDLHVPFPMTSLYFPAAHILHDPDPALDLNVPGSHAIQSPESERLNPATHAHKGSPPSLSELGPHHSQFALPATCLNLPASQGVHMPTPPVKPAGHASMQSLRASLPNAEFLPNGQSEQCSEAFVAEYLPTGHLKQFPSEKNCPAAQAPHVAPSERL